VHSRIVVGGRGHYLILDSRGYQIGHIQPFRDPRTGQLLGYGYDPAGRLCWMVAWDARGNGVIYPTNQTAYSGPPPPGAYPPPVVGFPQPNQFPGPTPNQFPVPGPDQFPVPDPGKGPPLPPLPGPAPDQRGGGVRIIVELPPVRPPYGGPGYEYPWDKPGYPGTPPIVAPPPRPGGPPPPMPPPPPPTGGKGPGVPPPPPLPPSRRDRINGTELAVSVMVGMGIGAIGDRRDRGRGAALGGLIFGVGDLILQSSRRDKVAPYGYINPNLPRKGRVLMTCEGQDPSGQVHRYKVHQNGAMLDSSGSQVLHVNDEGLVMGPRGEYLARLRMQ
jgi:hypothetical protein